MSGVTFNVSVTIAPETIEALAAVAEAVVKAFMTRPLQAAPREEEPLEIWPDPPVEEKGPGRDSPASLSAPADEGGGADNMLSPSPCRVNGVSSQTSPEALGPPAAFSGGKSAVTKWSAERVHALATEILVAVNKLPGLKISSVASVDTKYHELKRAGTLPAVTVEKKPAPAARPRCGAWTPERVECLRAMRAARKDGAEILEALNKLPGDDLGKHAINSFLKVPRNAGKFPVGALMSPAETRAEGKVIAERSLGPEKKVPAAVDGDFRLRGNDGSKGADDAPAPPRLAAVMTVADVIARREAGPREAAPAVVKTPVGAAVKHQVSEARQPAEPVSVDYDQARGWAARRGLVSGHEALDIDKVNAKRRQLGLGVFVMRDKGARKAA